MKHASWITPGLGTMLLAGVGFAAAVPPFYSGGASLFEPEIGIVNSGVVEDAQVIVSHDLKYVTINMQATNTRLLALKEFSFQKGPSVGFVGLTPATPPKSAKVAPGASDWHPQSTSAIEIQRNADARILEREGMSRVASLD